MSVYNKEHNLGVNNFMKDRKVREYLVKLKKFKHLDIDSDLDDFINAGKIKIEDMVSFYRKMKENGFIKLFEKKKLKLINASKIPDGIITPSDNNILSKSTEYKNYFYEIYWKNNENERKGFMSFSTCSDRYIDMLMGQIVNRQCEENFDIGCLLSQNPIYTGDTTNFGRLTYFVNEFDLYFFDFSSKDYIGRAAFRHYITGLILGSDYYDILLTYKTNIDTGVFADKTIPIDTIDEIHDDQEIYEKLTSLWGIGRWTVEMFMIFQLGRLNVWPTGDLAVRRGWDIIHKNKEETLAKALDLKGEKLHPYRSVVAWYCYQAVHESRGLDY